MRVLPPLLLLAAAASAALAQEAGDADSQSVIEELRAPPEGAQEIDPRAVLEELRAAPEGAEEIDARSVVEELAAPPEGADATGPEAESEALSASAEEPTPDRAPSPTGELNPRAFVLNSLIGLQFMVEASAMAMERPLRGETGELAAVLRDAHRALAEDLVAAMERGGASIPDDLRRLRDNGWRRMQGHAALGSELRQTFETLETTPDTSFERVYLQTMADGLESATRWWSAYAYRGETEQVRDFAEAALPTIRALVGAVQTARLERALSAN